MDRDGKKLAKKRKQGNARVTAASDTQDEDEVEVEEPSIPKQARFVEEGADDSAKEGSSNCELPDIVTDITMKDKDEEFINVGMRRNTSLLDRENPSGVAEASSSSRFDRKNPICMNLKTSNPSDTDELPEDNQEDFEMSKDNSSAGVEASKRVQFGQNIPICLYLKGSHTNVSNTDDFPDDSQEDFEMGKHNCSAGVEASKRVQFGQIIPTCLNLKGSHTNVSNTDDLPEDSQKDFLFGKDNSDAGVEASTSKRVQFGRNIPICINLKGSHTGASETDDLPDSEEDFEEMLYMMPDITSNVKDCILPVVSESASSKDIRKQCALTSAATKSSVVRKAKEYEYTKVKNEQSLTRTIDEALQLEPNVEEAATEEELNESNESSDYVINHEKAARLADNEPSLSQTAASSKEERVNDPFKNILSMYENYAKNSEGLQLQPKPASAIAKHTRAKSEVEMDSSESMGSKRIAEDPATYEQQPLLSDDVPSCSTAANHRKPPVPVLNSSSITSNTELSLISQELTQKKSTSTSASQSLSPAATKGPPPRPPKTHKATSRVASTAVEDNVRLVQMYAAPYHAMGHMALAPTNVVAETRPPEYHTLHILTASEPSISVMRRPPLLRRIWMVLQDFASLIRICIQVNKECLFCLVFFIAFIVSASYLTAFFYRILSVSPNVTHQHEELPQTAGYPPMPDEYHYRIEFH